jgi:hypothetical protein
MPVSALQLTGASMEEALGRATAAVSEAGAASAVLRCTDLPSTVFGSGHVLAYYSVSAGWKNRR